MKRHGWMLRAATICGLLAGTAFSAWAEDALTDAPESITMRGKTMQVWPFEDLRARGFDIPEVAREDNAFWTYLEAVNTFKDPPAEISDAFDYAIRTAWPTEQGEDLAAYLLDKNNQKALTTVRQAANREVFQLYYFGDPNGSLISVLLPSLKDYRFLGKLLVADGRRLAAQGDVDMAFQNYTAAMRMAHHVGGGITLIENLVGVAVWSLADQAVADLVRRADLSHSQLERMLDELRALAPLCPGSLRGVKNERVFGNSLIDEITSQPLQIRQSVQTITGTGGMDFNRAANANDGFRRLQARIGQVLIPDRTIKRHMNNYYDQLIERAAQPAYAARWDEFDDEAAVSQIPQWNVFARILLPSLTRANILSELTRMHARATRLTIALRLYALENEGLAPDRLADLAEWIPADELIDPFSGKPFVYDHREQAWRFYSYSENFMDDGGESTDHPFRPDFVMRFPPAEPAPFEPSSDE